MTLFGETKAPPSKPCARCGESAVFEIWGHAVCVDCAADWNSRPEHTAGYVENACGITWSESGPARHGKLIDTAEWTRLTGTSFERLTATWVKSKAKAA